MSIEMENSNNNPQNTHNNSHPKPTEDIHLNIETVTPDTEKEGQPNDQKYNHTLGKVPSGDASENPDDIKEDEDNESAQNADVSGDTQETETTGEEKPAQQNKNESETEETDSKESGDKRDEIETESV